MTSKELNIIVENIALRLYLFNYDYPTFIPQAIRAIMEHPNLLKSDKAMIETYCKIFELDWKGVNESILNNEFMSTHPIYLEGQNVKAYGEIDNEKVKEMLKRACAPFVQQAASALLQQK